MNYLQDVIRELELEAQVTRNYLAVVPFDKAEYQPASKSETLGRLAIHVAEIIAWWKQCLTNSSLDFSTFEPANITSTTELLSYFDDLLEQSLATLATTTMEELDKEWSMKNGDVTYFTLSKKQVIRVFCMNHLVHHRAQLGVYLRLLDISIPATYGPSADDYKVVLTTNF